MRCFKPFFVALILLSYSAVGAETDFNSLQNQRWSVEKARDWYGEQPWLVGCNFIPSTAINQLEMWQEDTFDPKTIDRELGWAEDLGFNTVRVYLHDLAYDQDPKGFLRRMDRFLSIAKRHKIKVIFVIFDDCWLQNPEIGKQPEPFPGVHNSSWVESPGFPQLKRYPNDPALQKRLETYVKAVLTRFGKDKRILMWDLYNEPGGIWKDRSGIQDIAQHKSGWTGNACLPLLKDVFKWAREVDPAQPLTVCHFGSPDVKEIALQNSDIITFHNYSKDSSLGTHIWDLKHRDSLRPMICTEFMARTRDSKFQSHLPIFQEYEIGALCWGLVAGKTQTIYPWESWNEPGVTPEPELWFHDIFRKDGTAFDPEEVTFIRSIIKDEQHNRIELGRARKKLKRDLRGKKLLWLEDLDLSYVVQGWGEPVPNKTILFKRMRINGILFERGVGTHALSRMEIDLKGTARSFQAQVGLDDEVHHVNAQYGGKGQDVGSVVFKVFVDGELAFNSGVMKYGDGPTEVKIDLTGAKTLNLIVEDGGDNIDCDHADWANAVLILDPNSSEIPCTPERIRHRKIILTPVAKDSPQINAPDVIGAGTHRDFLYYIPVSGKKPIDITVKGLPKSLAYDESTGIISGETGGNAEYDIEVMARNSAGNDKKTIHLSVGTALAKTPPMGWNSWNCWGTAVDENKIKAAADAMVESGLIDHGWTYINIDDAWHGERDPQTGEITSNANFPDMKALADYIHDKGLKFGVYTDVGTKTCAGFEGSKGHEIQDPKTYAKWGVDYVKVDWCNTQGMEPKPSYTLFGKGLAACGRDIVYSICNWGHEEPWKWGEEAGGNLWRTTGDITDTWDSVYNIINFNAPLAEYAGPGHWNDPDMLVVGQVGWGPQLRESRLTPNQQYSHISLWCLSASPLLLGCDLTQLDDFTKNLLTNDEVLAINQDSLGKQAQRVIQDDGMEIWVKDLVDGTKAVGIFNFKPNYLDPDLFRQYTLQWESIGLKGPQSVRDLWKQEDLGTFEKSFPVELQEYGVILIKVKSMR